MADPVTAGVFIGAGAVTQAFGQIQAAQAAKAQSEYNANIATQNAKLARQQAAQDERKFRVQAGQQLGDMRAQYAASGIDISGGSPLEIMEQSAREMEFDALNIKAGGELKGLSFESEAGQERFRGGQADRAGTIGAAASLLQGAGQYMSYNNSYKPKRGT